MPINYRARLRKLIEENPKLSFAEIAKRHQVSAEELMREQDRMKPENPRAADLRAPKANDD